MHCIVLPRNADRSNPLLYEHDCPLNKDGNCNNRYNDNSVEEDDMVKQPDNNSVKVTI